MSPKTEDVLLHLLSMVIDLFVWCCAFGVAWFLIQYKDDGPKWAADAVGLIIGTIWTSRRSWRRSRKDDDE